MKIRKADIWDTPKLVELWTEMRDEIATHDYMRVTTKQVEMFYAILPTRIYSPEWIIEVVEDNEIHGFIMAEIYNNDYNRELISNCESIYLRKPYRNKGIDKMLIDRATQIAREKGAVSAQFVGIYRPTLAEAWKRKGYEPVQVIYRKEL